MPPARRIKNQEKAQEIGLLGRFNALNKIAMYGIRTVADFRMDKTKNRQPATDNLTTAVVGLSLAFVYEL
jgi:protein tyrosine phosphatase (PTP) superfamily phosphohydrolase (DUF442 family)